MIDKKRKCFTKRMLGQLDMNAKKKNPKKQKNQTQSLPWTK